MERLTLKGGICEMASTEYCLKHRDCYECGHGRKVFKRLAAYEDTALEPPAFQDAMQEVSNHLMEHTQYRDTGSVSEAQALKDAQEKRQEGCEFCKVELRHFPYVVAHANYASSRTIYTPNFCPMFGRDLRGDNHG